MDDECCLWPSTPSCVEVSTYVPNITSIAQVMLQMINDMLLVYDLGLFLPYFKIFLFVAHKHWLDGCLYVQAEVLKLFLDHIYRLSILDYTTTRTTPLASLGVGKGCWLETLEAFDGRIH